MPKPYTPLVVSLFKGLNDEQPSLSIDETQGSQISNLLIRNGRLIRRNGSAPISSSIGANSVTSLAWCRIPDVTPVEYVVGVYQGGVYDFFNLGVVGAPTLLTNGGSRFSTTVHGGMAVLDNKLYIGDGGVNPMCRFNGTNVKKASSSAPTVAPGFTAFVGAGVLTGNVKYKVTYLTYDGVESEASTASATLAPVAQNVTLTIPNDTDADRSGKNVYRQGPTSVDYKLVNASPLAAGATAYTDSTTDALLGAVLVTGNTLFPSCRTMWEHDNRLFACNNASDHQTLFISNEFEPWYCPAAPDLTDPTQGVRLKIQGKSSVLIGGISHGGYCFIFTAEGGYILQGTTAEDYRLERFTSHGASCENTICSLRNYVFWLGGDGVYQYDGTTVERIDDEIRTFLDTLTAAERSISTAYIFQDRYYLCTNDGVRVYDTKEKVWTDESYSDHWRHTSVSATLGQASGEPRVFAVEGGAGIVLQLQAPATYTDTSAAGVANPIAVVWKSRVFDMGLASRDKRVHLWGAKFKAVSPGGNMTLELRTGSGDALQTVTFALDATAGDDAAVTPTNPTICTSRNEAVDAARSEFFQIKVSTSSTAIHDLQLIQAELFWTMAG